MEKIPEHDFTGSNHAELLDGLPVATRNEIGRLAQAFAFMGTSKNSKKAILPICQYL
jgi:HAMP domain-containing protein